MGGRRGRGQATNGFEQFQERGPIVQGRQGLAGQEQALDPFRPGWMKSRCRGSCTMLGRRRRRWETDQRRLLMQQSPTIAILSRRVIGLGQEQHVVIIIQVRGMLVGGMGGKGMLTEKQSGQIRGFFGSFPQGLLDPLAQLRQIHGTMVVDLVRLGNGRLVVVVVVIVRWWHWRFVAWWSHVWLRRGIRQSSSLTCSTRTRIAVVIIRGSGRMTFKKAGPLPSSTIVRRDTGGASRGGGRSRGASRRH